MQSCSLQAFLEALQSDAAYNSLKAEYSAVQNDIEELKAIDKPFIVLLNCMYPESSEAKSTAEELSAKYGVPVTPINCLELDMEDIKGILSRVLFEFPVKEIGVCFPKWVNTLPFDHPLRSEIISKIRETAKDIKHIRDIARFEKGFKESESIELTNIAQLNAPKLVHLLSQIT